jgi:alpha-aminoadipate/glutamate carrier protein LysW
MATCPLCDADDIEVDEYAVDEGDFVNCPECGASLEVTSLSPLEFESASDEEDEDEEEDQADEDEDEEAFEEDEDEEGKGDWDD